MILIFLLDELGTSHYGECVLVSNTLCEHNLMDDDKMLSAHGKYVANTHLQYPKGSFMSAYIQLFVAFFVSGIIHGAADFVAIHDFHRVVRNIRYFVLQAVAILFEDTVIAYGKKNGIKSVPKVVGYAWVVGWMVWSGPIWLETLVTEKLTNFVLPFSLLDLIYKNKL